tara:strand:- start:4502 stop:5101 length:600 start_codon:yes stop_codon:yes gene_type:complete
MKKIIITLLLITGFSITTKAQKETTIDLQKSTVRWFGAYSFDFGGHEGVVKIKEGKVSTTDGQITNGLFVMDMNTIANTDGDYSQDLVDHLKSEDFFEVNKYPTAKFVISNVKYHDPNNTKDSDQVYIRVHGNLTIKSTTLPMWFEAEINPDNTLIEGKFRIDRTLYGVNYKSKGLGASIKDGIISDAIEFRIALRLKK